MNMVKLFYTRVNGILFLAYLNFKLWSLSREDWYRKRQIMSWFNLWSLSREFLTLKSPFTLLWNTFTKTTPLPLPSQQQRLKFSLIANFITAIKHPNHKNPIA